MEFLQNFRKWNPDGSDVTINLQTVRHLMVVFEPNSQSVFCMHLTQSWWQRATFFFSAAHVLRQHLLSRRFPCQRDRRQSVSLARACADRQVVRVVPDVDLLQHHGDASRGQDLLSAPGRYRPRHTVTELTSIVTSSPLRHRKVIWRGTSSPFLSQTSSWPETTAWPGQSAATKIFLPRWLSVQARR